MERSHGRPHVRLPGYDYSSCGAYFLTICTLNRECLFGEIIGEEMVLNHLGRIVEEEWRRSEALRQPEMQFGTFGVMPNHLHGIVILSAEDEANGGLGQANSGLHLRDSKSPRRSRSISSFMAGFKATSTNRINALRGTPGLKVWQDNFYEHIIRNENSYHRIATYIVDNALRWAMDQENPARRP